MLLFKKKFLDAIRAGEKTQTIRLWKRRRLKVGQKSYIPGIGPITITAVDPVRLEELTEEDARFDGFDCLADLRRELANLYTLDQAGHQLYRVRFAVPAAASGVPRQQRLF